jgi:hypothetical protein
MLKFGLGSFLESSPVRNTSECLVSITLGVILAENDSEKYQTVDDNGPEVEEHARDLVRMVFGRSLTSQQLYQSSAQEGIHRILLLEHLLSKTSPGSGYGLPAVSGLTLLA